MNDSRVVKHQVKVREGMTQHLFVLSGELPSPDYVRSTFFLIKDMYPGAQINQGLNFNQTIIGGAFVSHTEADRIKFCSDNLPQILDNFSKVPDSEEAKQIEKIVKGYEEPTLIGEKKFCSTSLEFMIDNVVNLLRTINIKALSTTIGCMPPGTITTGSTLLPYEGFMVPLVGKDGSKVNDVAVCHHDTVFLNKLFLELLNMELGSVEPVCHFLPENHLLWVSSEAMSKAVDIYI
ncbi:BURP domain-containing protein 3-like [Carex rostrata]